MDNHVASTSDARTVNNHMRHQYRVLTDAEKADMAEIKDMGAAFTEKLHALGNTDPAGDRFGSRNLSLAFGHIEDAVYRAVKYLTT